MRKQSLLLGGIAFALIAASVVWAGITVLGSSDEPTIHADGAGLRVDVVAPKEPEIVAGSGQLGVGELANSYDHAETMSRIQAPEETSAEIGTSWDDDNWYYSEGTGPAMNLDKADNKQPLPTEKTVKVTKVPSGYEG